MSDKPLDCVGTAGPVGKHDFKAHADRPLRPIDKEFMSMMTETFGCKFIDVTPDKPKDG